MATLSEEIIKLTDPTPQIFDPEDDIITGTAAKVTSSFNENIETSYDVSELRSQTAPLLEDIDERYTGRKVSRKSLETFIQEAPDIVGDESEGSSCVSSDDDDIDDSDGSDDDGSETGDGDEDARLAAFKKQLNDRSFNSEGDDFDEVQYNDDRDNFDEDDNLDDGENLDDEEGESEDVDEDYESGFDVVQQFSNIDVESEIEKGKAVQAQQELWNKLCELRIRLQKLLLISNKLPQHNSWELFQENGVKEYSKNTKKGFKGMKCIVNHLLDLQMELLSQNPETSNLESGGTTDMPKEAQSGSDEEIPSDTDEDMGKEDGQKTTPAKKSVKRKLEDNEFDEFIQKRHATFIPYQNSVIQKWDEKTRLSAGRMSQKSFLSFENTALKQIEQVLQDKHRLIKRTQLKRTLYNVIGKPELSQEVETPENEQPSKQSKQDMLLKDYDPEIFDDDDFYRQLLKDIIESKSTGIDATLLRKQIEIQKIRSKMKKKVDTKASKGRKLRYDVHPKMLNFMAPVYENLMSDEARDNLFKSLYGQVNSL